MATIDQIRAKIRMLQMQADSIIAKQAQKVVDNIRNLMLEHGLTTEDIEAAAKKRRQGTAKKTASAAKEKLAPKYRNPKTGGTWSGRGKPPAWIANARDRTRFLIEKSEVSTSKLTRSAGPAKKKASAKRATVALYRDPESGATWTGHGRAPGWIAGASDRSVYLIARRAVRKVSAPRAAKKSTVKKAVTKKRASRAASA